MRWLRPLLLLAVIIPAAACDKRQPLTAELAQQIVSRYAFEKEPVYADVPQRVWWNPSYPKDEYDEKAVRTLQNLERAGLVTLKHSIEGPTESYTAVVTQKGFPILGTAPSFRGPVFRGMIAYKKYDGLRNFQRHPNEETTGHAELVWHYEQPTALYEMFETKINKPLNKPFVSFISFYHKDHQWRFDVTVRKADAEGG